MIFDTPKLPEDDWSYKPFFEARYRYERRNDRDLYDKKNDNRSDNYERFRVGLEAKNKRGVRYYIQYQYGLDDYQVTTKKSTLKNSDLDYAFVELPYDGAKYTIGRQDLKVGSGRLLFSMNTWGNFGRTFEGVRAQTKSLDLFAFKLGTETYYDPKARIGGVSYTQGRSVTSGIYKHGESYGPVSDVYTLNEVYTMPVGKYCLVLEGSGQAGRANGLVEQAWNVNAIVKRKFGKADTYLELNSASGGNDKHYYRTFDQLWGNAPSIYGMRIMQGNRNVNELSIGANYALTSKDQLIGQVNNFGLRDASDYWYGSNGVANKGKSGYFVDPTGKSGTDVGRDVQLEWKHDFDKHNQIWLGAAAFFPGKYVEKLNGSGRTQTWFFSTYTYRF